MAEFGLLGRKLSHSYSPELHSLFGDYKYELIELEPDELEGFFKKGDFLGLNVTIPYKKAVIPFCDGLSEKARRIGSVNTIVKRADGTLFGDNTDYDGFCCLLRRSGLKLEGKQCLILGTGGASLSVMAALKDLGALRVLRVSRTGELNYTNVYSHVDTDIIVNTTPVGMFPNCAEAPLNICRFQRLQALFDIIYNPARTQLMLDAMRDYTKVYGGLPMLVAQAAASSALFTGREISDEEIEAAVEKISFSKQNLLLIGMPGCGKTTVGKLLAEKLQREFLDLDERIEAKTGRSPEKIIKEDGEKAFRAVETELLEELSVLSGKIISCGGGVISPKKNRFIMKRNSTVIWLQRDVELLATEGRPLSQLIGTHELYRFREPLYIESADYTFTNNSTPEKCAEKIIRELGR